MFFTGKQSVMRIAYSAIVAVFIIVFLSITCLVPAFADETNTANETSSEEKTPYKLPSFVTGESDNTFNEYEGTVVYESSDAEEDESQRIANSDSKDNKEILRDKQGKLSYLNQYAHNPYNSQKVVIFDLGTEFATFQGDSLTEGYVIKCSSDDVLKIPTVVANPGYTFIGWSQGGVPEEVDWKARMKEVEISDEIDEKHIYVYAIYADDEGNGYCTCGAYTAGIYKDDLDTYKEEYKQYLASRGIGVFPVPQAVCAVIIVILVLGVVILIWKRTKNKKEIVSE